MDSVLKIVKSNEKVKIKPNATESKIDPNKSQRPSLRLKQMKKIRTRVYRNS